MSKLSKTQASWDYMMTDPRLDEDDTDIIEALEAEFDNLATNPMNEEIHNFIGDFIESTDNMTLVAMVLLQDTQLKDALREFYVDSKIESEKRRIEREKNDFY